MGAPGEPVAHLIGNGRTLAAVTRLVDADSLEYLSIGGMLRVLHGPSRGLCAACFTGDYPTAVATERVATVHAGAG